MTQKRPPSPPPPEIRARAHLDAAMRVTALFSKTKAAPAPAKGAKAPAGAKPGISLPSNPFAAKPATKATPAAKKPAAVKKTVVKTTPVKKPTPATKRAPVKAARQPVDQKAAIAKWYGAWCERWRRGAREGGERSGIGVSYRERYG